MTEELATFMTCFEIKDMFRKEKASDTSLDWEAFYPFKVAAKPYFQSTKCPRSRSMKGNTWKHVVRFLDFMRLTPTILTAV